MNNRPSILALCFLVAVSLWLGAGTPAHAQFHGAQSPSQLSWALYAGPDDAGTGQPTAVAVLTISIDPDWYTYSNNPGELGRPTRLAAEIIPGNIPLAVLYPPGTPKKDASDPTVMVNTYHNTVRLYLPLPPDVRPPFTIQAALTVLYCAVDRCLPSSEELVLPVETLDPATLPRAEDQTWWDEYADLGGFTATPPTGKLEEEIIPRWDFQPEYLHPGLEVTGLPTAILLGLLAGLILNVMPCVLPVVSLKLSCVLSGTGCTRDQTTTNFRSHNLYFALGVLSFFALLAVVLALTGQAWGALFQNPVIVLSMAAVVLALAFSLMGFFHLPIIDLKFETKVKNPHTQAFFTGALTTLLATPCSGPFLGGVLGWALLQPSLMVMAVFLSIGLGMAAPYFGLALFPGLARFLPKPGPWIEFVEKIVAFFLLATALYLIDIGTGGLYRNWLILAWAVPSAAWLAYRAQKASTAPGKIALGVLAILIAAFTALTLRPQFIAESSWETYDAATFEALVGKEPMFLKFTADWCPSCKVLERTVLTDANVATWKTRYNIRFIEVDLTEHNIRGEALLNALGSKSIPTSVLFSTVDNGRVPLVLRDLYTTTQLENVLKSLE